MVLGAACLVWALPGNAGATEDQESTTPTSLVGENATCSDLAPEGATWFELKVEPVKDGTFTDGTLTVTIDVTETEDGPVFDWTSNIGVDAVFVKGGPGGLLYVYDPESTGDTGLHAPVNPSNDKFFGLSHVSFCYDEDQPTTTTESTTTTTEKPTTTTESTTTTEKPTTTTESTTTTEKPTTTTESTTTTALAPSTTTTSLAAAPVGQLPRTGSGSQTLLIVAGIILLLGGGALLGSAKLGQGRLA
jgi:LPXTG-motif cell wall-anchored protein